MNKVYIYLIFLFCIGCAQSANDKILFYNGVSFSLNEGDSIKNKTQSVIDNYGSLFILPPYKIPLFKSIKAKESLIYLALPVNLDLEDLYSANMIKANSEPTFFYSDSTDSFYRFYSEENNSILEYGEKFDGNVVYAIQILNKKIESPLSHIQDFKSRFNR